MMILKKQQRGFTIVEILLAMAIFGFVLTAIYSTWTSLLRAARAGSVAAEEAQRERVAMRILQDCFVSAQMFTANLPYYSFSGLKDGNYSSASFVGRLPSSFPRGSRFAGLTIRRVSINVEADNQGANNLVLRQNPISMDLEEDERAFPLILARNVRLFEIAYWDQRKSDWVDEWIYTNQMPKLVRLALSQGRLRGDRRLDDSEIVTRIVNIPSSAVPPVLQVPAGVGGVGGVNRTNSQVPINQFPNAGGPGAVLPGNPLRRPQQ